MTPEIAEKFSQLEKLMNELGIDTDTMEEIEDQMEEQYGDEDYYTITADVEVWMPKVIIHMEATDSYEPEEAAEIKKCLSSGKTSRNRMLKGFKAKFAQKACEERYGDKLKTNVTITGFKKEDEE